MQPESVRNLLANDACNDGAVLHHLRSNTMKERLNLIALLVTIAVCGAALLYQNKKNTEEISRRQLVQDDTSKKLDLKHKELVSTQDLLATATNQIGALGLRVSALVVSTNVLTGDLLKTSADLLKSRSDLTNKLSELAVIATSFTLATNQLAQANGQLRTTKADLEKSVASTKALETANKDLDTKNKGLEQAEVEMRGQLVDKTKQIADTEKKLASSEGDRTFLLRELKRLQEEKTTLERQLNDIAVVKSQYEKLRAQVNEARRKRWRELGLNPDFKPGSVSLLNFNEGKKPATGTNSVGGKLTQVELNSEGKVTIRTNTPAVVPAPAPKK